MRIHMRLARALLQAYTGVAEVTITPDDEHLLTYAQGLHAKCDELGKARDSWKDDCIRYHKLVNQIVIERDHQEARGDELGNGLEYVSENAEYWFQKWADNQSFIQRLSHERDEFQLAWNATVVENDRLRKEIIKLQDECDELVADLGCAENDILNWEASRDEAREWALAYKQAYEDIEFELHQATCLDGQCSCWDEED